MIADDHRIPEGKLRALLHSVDLENLLDRPGGGEEVTNWGEVLSLGEQQRLGMARLFFHRPRFAILDECTSGVTVEMEQRFCNMVKDMGCTCVTISHRPALMAFHDLILNLDGEGGWTIHEGNRSAAKGGNGVEGEGPAVDALTMATAGIGEWSGGTKVRSDAAREVLAGMSTTTAVEQHLCDGNEGFSEVVVARAPPSIEGRETHDPALTLSSATASAHQAYVPPRLSLQPSKCSPLARWRTIMHVLITSDARNSKPCTTDVIE